MLAAVAFRRVAHVREIPEGRGHCVRVGGLEVGLFRVGSEIHAMENRCPHAESPLSEGTLEGPVIVCAAHGWRFDVRTGFRPESPDGWPIPCFPVRVEAGEVWIDVDEPTNLRRRPPRGGPGA
jgi:3-phenylpropionate/trans-cinnamate dioxygenase ferredoxin subunit